MRLRVLILVGATILAVPAAGRAAAQDPAADDRLDAIEQAIEAGKQDQKRAAAKARNLKAEIEQLRDRSVAMAAKVRDHEAETAGIEAKLAELGREEAATRSALRDRRDQFAQVLTALQALARHPPEALLVHPMGPTDMVRGAILLRAAVPEIERRAWRLRDDLDELRGTRATIRAEREKLARATDAMREERDQLDSVMKRKSALRAQAAAESRAAAKRVAALADEAEDLRDLMRRLEHEREIREAEERQRAEAEAKARAEAEAKAQAEAKTRATTAETAAKAEAEAKRRAAAQAKAEAEAQARAEATRVPISKSRGRLMFPAVGTVVGRYGQHLDTGLTRKGVDIQTRPNAQVVAPFGGRVAFAGPFRGYGLLLIIEHGEGYHSLLAGMARLDATLGQMVVAGEPVGRMNQPDSGNSVLYVELRRNGQPINPLPWLAAHKGGVSG